MDDMRGQLKPEAALEYLFAGNSTFTILNEGTGKRFTFKVKKADGDKELHFVGLLNGPDNEGDFCYLGVIWNRSKGDYIHGKKSAVGPDAPSVKAFSWVYDRLRTGKLPESVKLFHEGRCGRCGRKLTVPESVESGYGPECIQRMSQVA